MTSFNKDLSKIESWLPSTNDPDARPVVYFEILDIEVDPINLDHFLALEKTQQDELLLNASKDLRVWLPDTCNRLRNDHEANYRTCWMVKNQGVPDDANANSVKQEGKGRWEPFMYETMQNLRMKIKKNIIGTVKFYLEDDNPNSVLMDDWQITNWRLDFRPKPELMPMDLFCDTVTWKKEFSMFEKQFTIIVRTAHGWEPYDK